MSFVLLLCPLRTKNSVFKLFKHSKYVKVIFFWPCDNLKTTLDLRKIMQVHVCVYKAIKIG